MSGLDLDAFRRYWSHEIDQYEDDPRPDECPYCAVLALCDEVERLRVSVNKAAGFISTLPMCSAMHPQDVLAWLYADTPVDGVL